MTAIWPTELPKPMMASFAKGEVENRIKKRSDVGPAGYRTRFSGSLQEISVSLALSLDLYMVFENFHRDTLSVGSLPFWMLDPVTDGTEIWVDTNVPLLNENGEVFLTQSYELYLFGSELPKMQHLGKDFQVSFNLVRMP